MKKSYLAWNRESVTDELIEEHLKVLSKDKLKLHEDTRLTTTSDILARNKKRRPYRQKDDKNQMHRGRKKQA